MFSWFKKKKKETIKETELNIKEINSLSLEITEDELLEKEIKEKNLLKEEFKKNIDVIDSLLQDEYLVNTLETENYEVLNDSESEENIPFDKDIFSLYMEKTNEEIIATELKENQEKSETITKYGEIIDDLETTDKYAINNPDLENNDNLNIENKEENKKGFFNRLKSKLSLTQEKINGRIEKLLSSVREIDEDVLDELEEILITSDIGAQTTNDLLFTIRGQVKKKELTDSLALKEALKKRIIEMLNVTVKKHPTDLKPLVLLVVGVNGVGKTTTIAKLARRYKEENKKVLLAAGDTFRAAAVEQLHQWSKTTGVDIVSQPTGADPSAVVFDALNAAKARNVDVVIIDTAGRLHTKVNLMDELKKIRRVADKALPGSPHETILVVDGNTGQNALKQAETFNNTIGVDSIILTKLDGTAKGGIIVSIVNELKIPVTNIGIGESYEDLRIFNAEDFVNAIFEFNN